MFGPIFSHNYGISTDGQVTRYVLALDMDGVEEAFFFGFVVL